MHNQKQNNKKSAKYDQNFFTEVNSLIEHFKFNILRQVLPVHYVKSNEYFALNPKRNDRQFGSFKFNLATNKWADFADNAKGGDLISLYAYLKDIKQWQAAEELLKIAGRYL